MTSPTWHKTDPAEPGVYWVILDAHDRDEAEIDIYEMAHGWRRDPRPYPAIAELCRDDDEPDQLVPFFVGMEEYPFDALHHDYKEIWWYGPLELPEPPPGHLPLRPLGESGLLRFEVPEGLPPELGQE